LPLCTIPTLGKRVRAKIRWRLDHKTPFISDPDGKYARLVTRSKRNPSDVALGSGQPSTNLGNENDGKIESLAAVNGEEPDSIVGV
jgi:hypothetical protein